MKIVVGYAVLEKLITAVQNILLISYSKTAWPTKLLMPFSGKLLQNAYKKGVDNFEIAHKIC